MGSAIQKLRAALAPGPQEPLPSSESVPWRIVGIIYAIIMGDALAGEMLSPFVADMCKTRFGMSEEETGTALGFLVGAYYFAQFLSSFMIGHLSDRVGRRIPLSMGQIASCAGTILFAIAPTYYIALLIRAAVGLTNSNIAVARAAICDAAVGKARTLSLSYMGSLYALSRAIATSFSGFTTGVVIIADNPYLFTCLLGGGFIFCVIIATFLLFPETQTKEQRLAAASQAGDKSLLAGLKYIGGDPLLRKLFSLHCIHSFCNGSMLIGMTMYFSLTTELQGLAFTTRDMGIVFSIFGFVGFLFQITFFKKVVLSWGVPGTYSRGLLVSLFSTLAVPFTGVSLRLHELRCLCHTVFLIIVVFVQLVYKFLGPETVMAQALTWIFVAVVSAACGISFMMGLSVLGSMLANAADQSMQGLTQGANQSFSSLLRAFGPMISGLIFSWSTSVRFPYLMFMFLSALYLGCFLITLTISAAEKRRVEKTPEKAETVHPVDAVANHEADISADNSTELHELSDISVPLTFSAESSEENITLDSVVDDHKVVDLDELDSPPPKPAAPELHQSVEVIRAHLKQT